MRAKDALSVIQTYGIRSNMRHIFLGLLQTNFSLFTQLLGWKQNSARLNIASRSSARQSHLSMRIRSKAQALCCLVEIPIYKNVNLQSNVSVEETDIDAYLDFPLFQEPERFAIFAADTDRFVMRIGPS